MSSYYTNYYNKSSQKYALAAQLATDEGWKRGSHDWWNAIRYHMQFSGL